MKDTIGEMDLGGENDLSRALCGHREAVADRVVRPAGGMVVKCDRAGLPVAGWLNHGMRSKEGGPPAGVVTNQRAGRKRKATCSCLRIVVVTQRDAYDTD